MYSTGMLLLFVTFTGFISFNSHVSTSDATSIFGLVDFETNLDSRFEKLQQTLDNNMNSTLRTLSIVEIIKSRLKKLEDHIGDPQPNPTQVSVSQPLQDTPCKTKNVTCAPQLLQNKRYANQYLPAKLADGTIISRPNTTNKPWVQQIGDCGGILVGDKGMVSYTGQGYTGQIRCIWTIRANTKSKVHLKLLEDNLGDNWITISEYTHIYLQNNASETLIKLKTFKIKTGDRRNYTLKGPIVFLQLFQSAVNTNFDSNALPSSSFNLYFEGAGEETPNTREWKYTHYHFTKAEGSIKYPESGKTYGNEEIVTFVWNSIPVNFKVNLTNYDLENESTCNYDSLTVLYYTINYWVQQFGFKSKKYRYCGEAGTTSQIANGIRLDSLIAIFKSDHSTTKSGFQFDWGFE